MAATAVDSVSDGAASGSSRGGWGVLTVSGKPNVFVSTMDQMTAREVAHRNNALASFSLAFPKQGYFYCFQGGTWRDYSAAQ